MSRRKVIPGRRSTRRPSCLFTNRRLNRVESAGQVGTGVVVENIERVRDQLLDDQITYEKGGQGLWEAKKEYLHQIEMIINEPGEDNIRTAMDRFWEGWQKVGSDPTERAARAELIERSKSMTDAFNHTYNSLYTLREKSEAAITQSVNEVNNISKTIASLNEQIVRSENVGDSPNDLYDKRDMLIERLSKITDIRTEKMNNHEVTVYIGSENLVQGGLYHEIQLVGNPQNDGYGDVRWEDGRKVALQGGELTGLLSARDEDIKTAIANIDSLSVNLTDAVNEVHREGFGLNLKTDLNFFKELKLSPYANGAYDFNKDGIPEGTAIFKVSGTESLKPETTVGSAGFLNFGPAREGGADIVVNYQPTDTVQNVIERINKAGAGVSAYLTEKGQFSLKAAYPTDARHPEFVIRHLEDSGNLLTGVAGMLNASGATGAYDYRNAGDTVKFKTPEFNISFSPEKHPAAWMKIDDQIAADPDSIAAASGLDTSGDGNADRVIGLGDPRNALSIHNIRFNPVMVESQSTLGDYIQGIVGDFGTRSETAQMNLDRTNGVVQNLTNLREQISGVNVDEELTKMIMFQHGYNASARLVTTMDSMIQTLLRMGA